MSAPTNTATQTHYDPHFVEMMRGTPPLTWESTCLKLEAKLAERNQYIEELEGRLRVLWDKLEGERKHYNERIKRLEEAGDVLAQRAENLGLLPMALEGWIQAKEAKL